MQLTPEIQEQINSMNFITMLRHVRFDPIGSEWWIGEVGEAMMVRRKFLYRVTPHESQVAASKELDW